MRRKSIIKEKGMKTFRDTVRAMSAAEIILAMVEGLEKPYTNAVKMNTYGEVDPSSYWDKIPVCYGCAATNTICRIYNKKPIKKWRDFSGFTGAMDELTIKGMREDDDQFAGEFESAVNQLRQGNITEYNLMARQLNIVTIKNKPFLRLPYLNDEYQEEDLQPYRKLAAHQQKFVDKNKK